MSVPQSERRQSEVEYVVILQQLEIFFIEKFFENENPNYIPQFSENLLNLSIEAYNNATLYYEMCNGIVQGDLAHKKKYCKITMWKIRELAAQINIYVIIRMNQGKSYAQLLQKTDDLLKVYKLLQNQLTKLNKSAGGEPLPQV